MQYQYNDNELLYLMFEGEETALGILFNKYFGLINKRLRTFHIKAKNYDDFFQEGLMALNDAINTYNPYYDKTFNKYFDLILQRRIMRILRQERNYFYGVILVDEDTGILEEKTFSYNVYEPDYHLSDFEKQVYDLKFKKNYRASEIAKTMKCDVKKVYNTIFTIKQKVQKEIES